MPSMNDMTGGENGAVGGMTILVWLHGDELVARITRTPDVVAQNPVTSVVSTERQVLLEVSAWLSEVKQGEPHRP
jgi:hypothetical protein